MVAVAGRSKGCHTCKKRRIKCDEGKPRCERCIKANYTCAGYDRPLEFRHTTFDSPEHACVASAKDTRTSTTSNVIINTPKVVSPPNELSLVAFKEDISVSFLMTNFVWRTYASPWIQMAAKGELGQLPLDASLALSHTNFGNTYKQQQIKVDGLLQYSHVLNTLTPVLSDPGRPGVENLIIPILILLIHSSSQGDRQGSISHVRGLTILLDVCGPERFQREPLRHAFESCRATLVTAGLIASQRSFLEQEQWRTVPWTFDANSRSAQSRLVDILAFVPGFLELDKKLDSNADLTMQKDLIQQINIRSEELFRWRWFWESANLGTVHGERHIELGNPRPKGLEFSTVTHAADIMTYNAALIWLLGLLWKLDPQNTRASVLRAANYTHTLAYGQPIQPSPLHRPGEAILLRDVAIEIYRSFDFLIRNLRSSATSALFFLMPIGLAWSVLQHEDQWRDAINETLALSNVTKDYHTGQNVFGFGSYAIPELPTTQRAATIWLSHSNESEWNTITADN